MINPGQLCYTKGSNRGWYFEVGSWSLKTFDSLSEEDRRVVVYALNHYAKSRMFAQHVTKEELAPILNHIEKWREELVKEAVQLLGAATR